jgi:hypothetical protein
LRALIDSYIGGRVAIDKHLRVAAWRLPNDALARIIQGYLNGDGSRDPQCALERWRLGFCRNYALERDLRTAAARLGATLTLKPDTATYQHGESPNFRGEWRWARSGHWNEKDRGEVVEIRASRARGFWDIAVEDEPHLFALASGVLTHNCKPNPTPESVTDRPTKAHEYLFLLSRSERYYYDAESIKEAVLHPHMTHKSESKPSGTDAAYFENPPTNYGRCGTSDNGMRNRRSVWTVASAPFSGAHFACFPPRLIEPCILAGAPAGGIVLDPFMGSGTVAQTATSLGRQFIGCELSAKYVEEIQPMRQATIGMAL